MTDQELIDYYCGLLIRQYNGKPKARAHVAALVTQAVANQIIAAAGAAFDIETAVGKQLDILGKYKGITRLITGVDLTRAFFAMPPYDDADPGAYAGFATYDDADPTAFLQKYADAAAPYVMNDEELRAIIKLKILVDKTDCSLADIDAIFTAIFGTQCIATDNGDMSMTYAFTVTAGQTVPIIAAKLGIYPKPAGVAIDITGIS